MSLNATKSKQTKAKLTKAMIADLKPASKDYFLWDTQMSGFGLKVSPQNRKTYLAQFRIAGVGNAKRMTIGVHGQMDVRQAQLKAADAFIGRVKGMTPPLSLDRLKRR